MEVTIREATCMDLAAIESLFLYGDMLHHRALPELFCKPTSPSRNTDLMKQWISDSSAQLLVAEAGNTVVGFIHAFIRYPPEYDIFKKKAFILIDSMVISPPQQKSGVGSLLMNEIEKWARLMRIQRLELNVYNFNQSAISFYVNHDFNYLSHRMYKQLNEGQDAEESPER